MSMLASLAFTLAALAVVFALRATLARYREATLRNVAALCDSDAMREFRVQAVSVIVRPAAGGDVRRIAARGGSLRRIKPSAGRRVAA